MGMHHLGNEMHPHLWVLEIESISYTYVIVFYYFALATAFSVTVINGPMCTVTELVKSASSA